MAKLRLTKRKRSQIQNMTSRLRSSDISIPVRFYQNYIIFILRYSYVIRITFIQNVYKINMNFIAILYHNQTVHSDEIHIKLIGNS